MAYEPDHLITVSAAARALGLRRKDLQRTIADGLLQTFEGQIRVSDLEQAFPNFKAKTHFRLAQLENIKLHAGAGSLGDLASDGAESLEHEVVRLRRRLGAVEAELMEVAGLAAQRREVISQLHTHIADMQARCDKRESAVLGSVAAWLIAHAAERQQR